MASYLKTFYQGVPLYYAGNTNNIVRLEPQKHHAILFNSRKIAEYVAKNLEEKYSRNDFYVAQKNDC